MNAEPRGDEIIAPNEAVRVVEELLPAQNQSYELGLKLNLPPYEVKSIHSMFPEPRKRLLHVVMEFLNQVEPRPTWKLIIEALKSPLVNLPELGLAIEEAHFPSIHTEVTDEVIGKRIMMETPELTPCFFRSFSTDSTCHHCLPETNPVRWL